MMEMCQSVAYRVIDPIAQQLWADSVARMYLYFALDNGYQRVFDWIPSLSDTEFVRLRDYFKEDLECRS